MKLYGVFFEINRNPKWAMAWNKRHALKAARQVHGYVTAMNEPSGSGPWDAPTFKACSDLVADYRVTHPAGTRIRLHPACDYFARGAHYATIVSAAKADATRIRVALELSGATIGKRVWIRPSHVLEVIS